VFGFGFGFDFSWAISHLHFMHIFNCSQIQKAERRGTVETPPETAQAEANNEQ